MDSGEFLLVIERYVDIEYNVRLFPLKLVGGPPQAARRYYDTTSPPHLVPKIIKEAEKRRKKNEETRQWVTTKSWLRWATKFNFHRNQKGLNSSFLDH